MREGQDDLRDTTTPSAALESFQSYAGGDVLSEDALGSYLNWIKGGQVTANLLRKSLPAGWEIGDRSGADLSRTRSIIAAIWPPARPPVYVAIYTDHANETPFERRNEVIAELGATIFDALQHTAN